VSTARVSVSSAGVQADGASSVVAVSADGRYVLFNSKATNLVGGDTNGVQDVFLRDRVLGKTFRVSGGNSHRQANGASWGQAVTPDGRFVVFISTATNLVGGDSNHHRDVFVRDRKTGRVYRVSLSPPGDQFLVLRSMSAHISADGRWVLFTQGAFSTCLSGGAGSIGCREKVFLRHRVSGGVTAAIDPTSPLLEGQAISADARYVVLTASDDKGDETDVIYRDRSTNHETQIDRYAPGNCTCGLGSSMTPDGRYVVFSPLAGDQFAAVRWTQGATTVVPVASAVSDPAGISDDGRYVGYVSNTQVPDLFRNDLLTNVVTRIDLTSTGRPIPTGATGLLSGDGAYAVFQTADPNVVPDDTNHTTDVFIRGPLP